MSPTAVRARCFPAWINGKNACAVKTGGNRMRKKYKINIWMAAMFGLALLTGCSGSQKAESEKEADGSDSDHPVITMNAPYRNMSAFVDLVHEKYPEIQLEVIPYNGQNTSAYMKDMRLSGQMADIYFTSYYTPGRYSDDSDFLDLSTYDFTENFTQSRLREVTWNGGIYMLPLSYNALGITYNKTLLEKNGWTLPTNLDELETLKGEAEEAGCVFSRCQLQYPGYGFQFLCDIADTGFLGTMEGITWQEQFLKGEANASDTPKLVQTLQILNRWREMGMLNGDGTPTDDTATKKFVSEGNTLFLVGNSNDLLDKTDTSDTYRLMPFLSEDGSQNIFVLVVSRYVGLNKKLGEPENQAKLQDALHVMEILSTEEGIRSLEPSQSSSRLLPLKDWTPGPDSYYVDMLDDLNSGHTANNVYSGWENIVVPVGEKMIDFICGATDEVAEEGGLTDSGILGLDAAREYFSQFETLSKKDIRWE